MSSGKYRLNTVNVRLVKESTILSDYPIVSSESAVKLAAEEFKTYDREVVAVINLTRREQEIPHFYKWWDELRLTRRFLDFGACRITMYL